MLFSLVFSLSLSRFFHSLYVSLTDFSYRFSPHSIKNTFPLFFGYVCCWFVYNSMQSIFAGAFLQLRKLSHDTHSQFADQHLCFSSSLAVFCHHRQWHWFAYTSIALSMFGVQFSTSLSLYSLFSCLLFLVSFFSLSSFFHIPVALYFYLSFTLRFTCWSRCFFLQNSSFFATTLTYTISHPRANHTVVSRPMCVRQQHWEESACFSWYKTRDFLFVFLLVHFFAYHSHTVFHLPRAHWTQSTQFLSCITTITPSLQCIYPFPSQFDLVAP